MAIDIFSVQPHVVSRDIGSYITCVYGNPGVGKTTFATGFKNHLILAFEKGYSALPGVMSQPINNWMEFITVVNQLKKPEAKEKFKTIIIDTADLAYDACENFICQRAGSDNINEGSGLSYGQGMVKCSKEFDDRLRTIISLGYGVVFISHAEEKNIKIDDKNSYTTMVPAANKRGSRIIQKAVDNFIYISSVPTVDPATNQTVYKRYMFFRESQYYMAKSRFKCIVESAELSYANYEKAVLDAIDQEAKENGGKYVTDEKVNDFFVENKSTKTFEEVNNEFTSLTDQIMEKGINAIMITDIIERILGVGKLVKDCKPNQQSFIELINQDLQNLLNGEA